MHKRINYLKYLVNSLSHAKDIYKVLLVFSHDVYEKEINDFVQAIDFCKVIQIFYPHSLQTHPHTFPGKDPNDCPRNITKDKWAQNTNFIKRISIAIIFILELSSKSAIMLCIQIFMVIIERQTLHRRSTTGGGRRITSFMNLELPDTIQVYS